MLVKKEDGQCRTCGGQLEITSAEDAMMDVQCTECDDNYTVEPDAFNDGAITYWPAMMLEQEFGPE